MKLVRDLYRILFAHPSFQKLNTGLFELSLHGLGVLNYRNDRASGERHLIERVLPKLVSGPRPVIFDVGANIGDYSAMLLRSFPSATVHAFEPHPATFARLKERRWEGSVTCHEVAVGGAEGVRRLYDRADMNGSSHASLHEVVISGIHHQQVVSVDVRATTLDTVAAERAIDFIDFLKIDTEGSELEVLNGASRLIGREAIGCIQFEFNEMNVASRVFLRDSATS
jgi:FkbM family methyltransferase